MVLYRRMLIVWLLMSARLQVVVSTDAARIDRQIVISGGVQDAHDMNIVGTDEDKVRLDAVVTHYESTIVFIIQTYLDIFSRQ